MRQLTSVGQVWVWFWLIEFTSMLRQLPYGLKFLLLPLKSTKVSEGNCGAFANNWQLQFPYVNGAYVVETLVFVDVEKHSEQTLMNIKYFDLTKGFYTRRVLSNEPRRALYNKARFDAAARAPVDLWGGGGSKRLFVTFAAYAHYVYGYENIFWMFD